MERGRRVQAGKASELACLRVCVRGVGAVGFGEAASRAVCLLGMLAVVLPLDFR